MLTILALDPGVTTGWCIANVKDDKTVRIGIGQTRFTEADLFAWLVDYGKLDGLIYETFEYRNRARTGLDLTPVRMIGVIELYVQLEQINVWKQSAATGKGFYNNGKLHDLGVYEKGLQHGRDASRHMLHFMTFGPGVQFVDIDNVKFELVDADLLLTTLRS